MGQGLYTMLGYGVVDHIDQVCDEENEETGEENTLHFRELLDDELHHLIKEAYETDEYYIVFPIAVDDRYLQELYKVPDLPYDAIGGMVGKRQAKSIPVDEFKLSKKMKDVVKLRQKQWAQMAKVYKPHGISLPKAEFILINDWD